MLSTIVVCFSSTTTYRAKAATEVAQTSKSAVSWVSKPANRAPLPSPADLEIGDTAGLETCATPARRLVSGFIFIRVDSWLFVVFVKLLFGVFRVTLRDLRLFFIAGVNIEAVAEGDIFPGRHGEIAGAGGFLFKIMQPERIGAEQTVIAHVPPGRVPRVLWMIENCDANSLAMHRPVVVHPIRSFAPGRVV